jgi:hypothetical protein
MKQNVTGRNGGGGDIELPTMALSPGVYFPQNAPFFKIVHLLSLLISFHSLV